MGGSAEREQKGRQGRDCTEPIQFWWELGFYSVFKKKKKLFGGTTQRMGF